MTEWTPQGTIETAYTEDFVDERASVLYNSIFAYNLDFITYDGSYLIRNTDWAKGSAIETAWA